MSDMSILSNNAAASSKAGKQSNASANVSDEAPTNILPFGEVLARQLSDKTLIDVKNFLIDTQADAKPLELSVSDVAIVASSDTNEGESNVDATSTNLPTDLLATILPQTVAAAVAAVNVSTQPSSSGEKEVATVDKRAIASDKGTAANDNLKGSLNIPELAAATSTSATTPKTVPATTSQVGTLSNTDKLKVATVAPKLNAVEVALKNMPTITVGKDSASTTNIPSGTTYASEANAGMITLKAAPATTTSKESASTTNLLQGIAGSAVPNTEMAGFKTIPTITTRKDTVDVSTKLKSVVDTPEQASSKVALNTLPAIDTNAKVVATVVAFAQEVELSDKLDASMAVPLTQAAIPQANLVQSMANVSPIATQATQLVIDTPVTQKQWGNEFSQKITWMATQQDQHAELHLNPAQLGPVDVVIKVSGDQATAQFTSAHAAVREVIEQSIPKLREMLADNGIMLGNTTVSDQAPREQRGEFGNQRQTAPNGRVLEPVPSNMSDTRVVSPLSRHNGMVDTFA